jgi:hypothetical protein
MAHETPKAIAVIALTALAIAAIAKLAPPQPGDLIIHVVVDRQP